MEQSRFMYDAYLQYTCTHGNIKIENVQRGLIPSIKDNTYTERLRDLQF